jgi:hypothetical protein
MEEMKGSGREDILFASQRNLSKSNSKLIA